MMFPLYILLLIGSLLLGLVLLATGVILLIKVKNKIAGILVTAAGLAFTLFPIAGFMFFAITSRIQS